jgi:hypothetical protein
MIGCRLELPDQAALGILAHQRTRQLADLGMLALGKQLPQQPQLRLGHPTTAIASNRRRLGLRRPQRPARGLHLQERSCLRALHQGHILFQLLQRNLLHAVGPCHVDQRDGHVQQPLADQHVDVQAPVAKIRRPHADGCLQIGQCLGTAQLVQTQQLGHAVQRLGMGRLLLQHLFIGLASLLELPLFMQLAGLLQMLVRIHLGHQGCGQAPHHRPGAQADTRTNTAIVQASRQARPPDKRAQTAFLPPLPDGPVTSCYKTGSTPRGCMPSSPASHGHNRLSQHRNRPRFYLQFQPSGAGGLCENSSKRLPS